MVDHSEYPMAAQKDAHSADMMVGSLAEQMAVVKASLTAVKKVDP